MIDGHASLQSFKNIIYAKTGNINSQNSSSVPIKGEYMNSLMAVRFHSLLQYSILKVNISMFKRQLNSKQKC